MNENYKSILFALLRRGLPALVAFGVGGLVLLSADGSVPAMLLGFAFFLVAGIFLAGPVARLCAEPMGSVFWPRKYYDRPQPIYGIAESKRVKGFPEEALAEYEKLAAAFPGEVRPHLEMIEIALSDLKDPALAETLYQRSLAFLPAPRDRELLAQVYGATHERQAPRPVRHLEMPPHPAQPQP